MIKNRLVSFTLLLLCFVSLKASIQNDYHEIKNYISDNISVENQNWNIYQHPGSGFIYLANSEGLVEYDGLTSRIYKMPFNKGLRSVFIDKAGVIFTGGFEEMGLWQKERNCKLQYKSFSKLVSIKENDEIWKIYAQNGKVYFQSFTSIYIYDYKTVRKVEAPFILLFMFPMKHGFLVQAIDKGLYNFENDKFSLIPGSNVFASMKIHTIVPYPGNAYLIGTANDGLFIYRNNRIEPFPCEVSDFLKYNTCNAGLAINDSLYIFGTILNGIVEFNQKGEIKKTFNFSNGLKNNTVLSLYKDKDQGLWVGLDQGVNYLDILSPIVQYTNVTGTLGTIYTILKKDNLLYIGTNQGLFTARINNNKSYYSFNNIRMVPGSQGQVWTLREFDGQVLCGHNDGTFIVENMSFRKISSVTGGWSLLPFTGSDRQKPASYLIEGTYTGLVLFDKGANGKWKFRNRINNFGAPSRHVEVDYLGYIWASHHQRGIYKIELNKTLDEALHPTFFGDIAGASGNIDVFKINNRIVFTGSDKLYTFDYDADKIVPFTQLNNQLKEFSRAAQIVPYDDNQYWFVYENKIALFEIGRDFKTHKIFEFNQKNIHSPGNDLEISKIDGKNVLFPNHSGFVILDVAKQERIVETRHIIINKLSFQGKGETKDICSDNANLRIPYYLNNLTVYFSDPAGFNLEEKLCYYRIPELENEWHVTSLNNFSYNNVMFGSYSVEIKPDVNAEITSLRFVIKAPWYLTYIAFAAYIVILILLAYFGYRIFHYELKKQKTMVEMEVKRNTLENELDIKSNELMLTMRYLIQKNEILTELKSEIDALKEQSAKYPVKHIKNLEKIINEGLDTQTESWKSAMNNLKLSEQGFFRRLKEKHPELTPNDLRLCSYLRMNFTTKEIAHLLNISGRGVEIGRYRLRKKMNLPHDVNLSEYLMDN